MRKAYISIGADGKERNLIMYDGMTPENTELILNSKFDHLTLSYGDWDDLSVFSLAGKKIRSLAINCYGSCNFEQLSALRMLKRLEIGAIEKSTVARKKIDFSWFPELEYCEIDWTSKIMRNFFSCPRLQYLQMRSYKAENFQEISNARNLRSLVLLQSNVQSLDGIEQMQSLEVLKLALIPKLKNIARLIELPHLKDLSIEGCVNIDDFDVLFSISGLREIGLRGGVKLSSMRKFSDLKDIRIINIDSQFDECDFQALFGLKELRSATFIGLKNCDIHEKELRLAAARCGVEVELEILDAGQKETTVVFSIKHI